ncbi:MAG: F0F1 ATP synthase subunit B' [Pseudomonadota bacterium]
MPQFDPTYFASQLFWLAVTFAVLYWLLNKIAIPHLSQVFSQRSERITEDLEQAEKLRAEAEEAMAAYEDALAGARKEAGDILTKTKADIAAMVNDRQATFQADLAKRIGDAETRIAKAKEEAAADLLDISTGATEALTAKLLGKAPTKAAIKKSVTAALKEVG